MRPRRISTGVRFEPATHEALEETAEALGVSLNWLVNKLCEEGLARVDLSNFSLVRALPSAADSGTPPENAEKEEAQ